MTIVERYVEDAVILDLSGRFEFQATPQFFSALDELEERGCEHVILNLEDVTFLDSAALSALHRAHQRLSTLRGTLSIVNPVPQVQRLMERANLTSIIPIHTVEEQALLVG